MMLFEWKLLFGLTNLGKKVKGLTSLVERKETNILASIDVTVLGKYGQVQSPEAVMDTCVCDVSASFYVLGQVKKEVDTLLAFSLMKQAKVMHYCSLFAQSQPK